MDMLTAQTLKERFQFTYESGIAGSYLVVRGKVSEKIHHYQIEMIASNPREGILPMDVRQKDDSLGFYYNITSRQSLGQFLKRRRTKEEELVHILEGITRTLLESRNYLLRENLFLLDEEFMYINPNTMDVSLVYLPIENVDNPVPGFKEFLVKLIMFTVEMEESGNGLLQKILIDAKRETFSIGDLHKLLMDSKNKADVVYGKEEPLKPEKKTVESFPKQMLGPLALPKQEGTKRKEDTEKGMKFKIPSIPMQENKAKTEIKKKEENPKKSGLQLGYKTPVLAAMVVLQVVTIGVLFFFLNSGILDSLSEDTTTTYGAFALILGAVDFLLLRKLMDPKNRTIVRNTPGPVVPSVKKTMGPISAVKDQEKKPVPAVSESEYKAEAAVTTEFNDATALLGHGNNGTVPLKPESRKPPYLQSEDEGDGEEIVIEKTEFVIGRLKGQVDYVAKNNAIGKMHVEFINRNGIYYIKDLNSRNGTFVNDVRIDSNTEFEIRDMDRIALANSRYVFHKGML